jgi:hypothetical protein
LLEDELKELDDELFEKRETYCETRNNIVDKQSREKRADVMKRVEEAYCSYGEW